MSLFTINLGASGFFLDVVCDEIEDGFISSFTGQFRKEGVITVYPKLYWQIVKVAVGIRHSSNIAFALDVNGSTEPFTSLYDISRGLYREQVANAMKVSRSEIDHDLLVLNGIDNENVEPVESEVIALAIKKIESIQTFDVGLTGYFTDNNNDDSQNFISFLNKFGFQTLGYDGFVSQEATMLFRPQSVLLESFF
jgi:hypothetical protein